jgi:hypothetical protein
MKDTKADEKEKTDAEKSKTSVTLTLPLIEIDISQTVQSIFNITEPTDHDNNSKA